MKSILIALTLVLTVASLFASVPVAAAHPLGNFTINRYSRIEVSPTVVRIRYVVDMAEIPTFQAMAVADRNGDGLLGDDERAVYLQDQLSQILQHLRLTVGRTEIPLQVTSSDLALLPGQAGLSTLRISAWLEARAEGLFSDAPQSGIPVTFRDANMPDRLGWREIVVRAADGVTLQGATVPSADTSDELRSYPMDLMNKPLDIREARFDVTPVSAPAEITTAPSAPANMSLGTRARDGFADLIGSQASPLPIVMLALLMAVVFGAMHALSPGHGKTIVGAYLIGSRGTARHALFLGVTVTMVHTLSVFALGLATLYASHAVLPEQVYPWLSLVSGLLVLTIGITLVHARLQAAGWFGEDGVRHHRHGLLFHHHTDGDDLHDHHGLVSSHVHGDDPHHHHGHTHAMPGVDGSPVTWRSLAALGISGGLLPCPSALVMMLGAIALGQIVFGLVLLIAFSAGLAATLTAIGLLVVYSGQLVRRSAVVARLSGTTGTRLAMVGRLLPIAGALVVSFVGLALTVEAIQLLRLPQLLGESGLWHNLSTGDVIPLFAIAALVLGLRHGIDWDHIAAISDLTSASGSPTRSLVLASMYAIGHGLIVLVLGCLAIALGIQLPDWVDAIMEPIVGLTLVALAVWLLYALIRGDERMVVRSRLMLVRDGVQWAARWLYVRRTGQQPQVSAASTVRYSLGTAGVIGIIHAVGAETPTQLMLFAAATGIGGAGDGLLLVLLFVLGLIASNTGIALVAIWGYGGVQRHPVLTRGAGAVTAVFSFALGVLFLTGNGMLMPELLGG